MDTLTEHKLYLMKDRLLWTNKRLGTKILYISQSKVNQCQIMEIVLDQAHTILEHMGPIKYQTSRGIRVGWMWQSIGKWSWWREWLNVVESCSFSLCTVLFGLNGDWFQSHRFRAGGHTLTQIQRHRERDEIRSGYGWSYSQEDIIIWMLYLKLYMSIYTKFVLWTSLAWFQEWRIGQV